jgi:hypothetical protein
LNITFEAAKPVKIEGTGSKKADNPFQDAVNGIAWQTDTDGDPKALSYVEEHTEDEKDRVRARIARLLSDAGKSLEEPGTVRRHFADVTGGTKVTFWVTKLQKRPRKTDATPAE